jgi:hypothetical protein
MSFREPPFLRLLARPRPLTQPAGRALGNGEAGIRKSSNPRPRHRPAHTPPTDGPRVRLPGQAQPAKVPGAARPRIAACRCRACLTARNAAPHVAVRSAADCPPAPRRAASQHPRSDTGNGRSDRRACASCARTIKPANTQTRSCGPCAGRTVGSQVIFQASPAGSLPEDGRPSKPGASGAVNRLLGPESVRHTSVTTATRGLTSAHHETQRDKKEKTREAG